MLRIVDELTGPGPLRVCAYVPAAGDPTDPGGLTGLRVLLVADVLARVVEMRGRAVLMGWTGPEVPAVAEAAAEAGIHPADAHGTPDEIAETLGGPPVIHVTDRAYEGGAGATLQIAEAHAPGVEDIGDLDPLALRLCLLGRPHHEPLALTAEAATNAAGTLARWRRAVATWADQPSKPMPAELVLKARTAFEQSLDTLAVVRLLHDLESADDVPPGARFETFAYLDRVLGLELTSEIGRAPAGLI